MKKGLILLLLAVLLATLSSCGDESQTAPTTADVTGTSLNADTAAAGEETGADADDTNRTEYFVYKDRILTVSDASQKEQKDAVDAVSNFFRKMPGTVSKYLMLSPSRIAFEEDEAKAMSQDQQAEIQSIYASLDASVIRVDAYYALSQHADPLNDIFFRTENHWTQLGAYYAAQAFFDAAGIAYHKLDEYTRYDGGEFLGYLEDVVNDPDFYDKPDTLTYYLLPGVNRRATVYIRNEDTGVLENFEVDEVNFEHKGYEIYFWRSGYSHVIVAGNEESDRALLVVGDSYINAIGVWLADSFCTVILVDPRYFEGNVADINALIEQYGVTDAMVLASSALGLPEAFKNLY